MSRRRPYVADPRYGPRSIFDAPLSTRQRFFMLVLDDRSFHNYEEIMGRARLPDRGVGHPNRWNPIACLRREMKDRYGVVLEEKRVGGVMYVRWGGTWAGAAQASSSDVKLGQRAPPSAAVAGASALPLALPLSP